MKKLLVAAGMLPVLAVIGAVALALWLDGWITRAVNAYGPEITGTEVRADDVRVSFLSGRATITNFTLGNPKGFRSPRALTAASVSVSLELPSLISDTLVIRRLEIVGPDVTYEKRAGTDNFKTIARHAGRKAKEAGLVSGETGGKRPGRKLLIREFIVRGGRVTLHTPDLPSGAASAAIPDMRLRNVGGDGAEPSAVFGRILAALHERLTMPIVADSLNRSLLEARKAAEKGTRSLADRIRDVFR
ncbi:MAG: hypothetical protein HPY67_07625 [Syntrophaceae bacterium]|nr:hypothetical protein [Syntrophaceae bacterium]